jgi:hypothetical protein
VKPERAFDHRVDEASGGVVDVHQQFAGYWAIEECDGVVIIGAIIRLRVNRSERVVDRPYAHHERRERSIRVGQFDRGGELPILSRRATQTARLLRSWFLSWYTTDFHLRHIFASSASARG